MRLSVSLIVNLVANRMTPAEIVSEYPSLEEEDVVQALRYAAWTSDDVFIPAAETITDRGIRVRALPIDTA
jgi:uncharacterized protein (DUF433 family)